MKARTKKMTAVQKTAMNREILMQCAEYDSKNELEIDALILWQLHEQLGFGKKRLKRFYENFKPAFKAMLDRYELEEGDQVWLATHKLKELGIDISEWGEE